VRDVTGSHTRLGWHGCDAGTAATHSGSWRGVCKVQSDLCSPQRVRRRVHAAGVQGTVEMRAQEKHAELVTATLGTLMDLQRELQERRLRQLQEREQQLADERRAAQAALGMHVPTANAPASMDVHPTNPFAQVVGGGGGMPGMGVAGMGVAGMGVAGMGVAGMGAGGMGATGVAAGGTAGGGMMPGLAVGMPAGAMGGVSGGGGGGGVSNGGSAGADGVEELHSLMRKCQLDKLIPILVESGHEGSKPAHAHRCCSHVARSTLCRTDDIDSLAAVRLLTDADFKELGVSVGLRRKLFDAMATHATHAAGNAAAPAPPLPAAAPHMPQMAGTASPAMGLGGMSNATETPAMVGLGSMAGMNAGMPGMGASGMAVGGTAGSGGMAAGGLMPGLTAGMPAGAVGGDGLGASMFGGMCSGHATPMGAESGVAVGAAPTGAASAFSFIS
jgi:hypothetical protein